MLQRNEARRGLKVAPPAFKAGLTNQIGKLQSDGHSRPGFRALRFFQENGKRRWVFLGERSMTISMR
jgi:hypothetical protein